MPGFGAYAASKAALDRTFHNFHFLQLASLESGVLHIASHFRVTHPLYYPRTGQLHIDGVHEQASSQSLPSKSPS